jgi:hypothetical protein
VESTAAETTAVESAAKSTAVESSAAETTATAMPPPNAKAGPLATNAAPSAAVAIKTPKRLISVSSPAIIIVNVILGRRRLNSE